MVGKEPDRRGQSGAERSGKILRALKRCAKKSARVLDRLGALRRLRRRDDFRDDLAEYLEAHTECEIEITPGTLGGQAGYPDR